MRLNNKEKGGSGVLDLFPIILGVLFGAYFLINFGYYIKYLDVLNDLENVSRKYVLIMETSGGMTNDNLEKLYRELEVLGIDKADVDMSGTTFYEDDIKYGDELFFQMTVWVPSRSLLMSGNMAISDNKMKREVVIKKCAIALS